MSAPRNRPRSRTTFWQAFAFGICATSLSAVSLEPALSHAWWHPDDSWTFTETTERLIDHCVSIGRPLQAIWYLTFLTERGGAAEQWNELWRALQIARHIAAVLIAGRTLRRAFPHPAVAWALLPFLLWPFAAEATTWRAAGCYPLAALWAFEPSRLERLRLMNRSRLPAD